MKLQTKYFGEIDYEPSQALTFPNGLFGFEEERSFLLLPFEGSGGTMLCLQSTATGPLAFVLLDPLLFGRRVQPGAERGGAEAVRRGGHLKAVLLCALRGEEPRLRQHGQSQVPSGGGSPERRGRQIILETDRYGMRHPLSEFKREGAEKC